MMERDAAFMQMQKDRDSIEQVRQNGQKFHSGNKTFEIKCEMRLIDFLTAILSNKLFVESIRKHGRVCSYRGKQFGNFR